MRPTTTDQSIDRALSALAGVEPSPGLESRLLHGLEQRTTETKDRRSTGVFGGVFRIAAACAAALVVLILAFAWSAQRQVNRENVAHLRSRPPVSSHTSRESAHADLSLPDSASRTVTSKSAAVSGGPRPGVFAHTVPSVTSAADRIPVQLEVEAHEGTIPTARELDLQALEDLHAASSPAPPSPPTAQERLVRLMLRRGEKHDLAQLDPAEEATFARQEQAAFHEFFDPPLDPRILHQTEPEQDSRSTSTNQPKTEGQPQ